MNNKLGGNTIGKARVASMEIRSFRDNELITGISILAVLNYTSKLEFSKCMLIEPLLSYSRVVKALARANSGVKSVEDLILKENVVFSDFNSRYQEKLLLSINSILLFKQMGLISLDGNFASYTGEFFDFYNPNLGEKATARIKAAKRLSEILLKEEASDFYLSLRIEV